MIISGFGLKRISVITGDTVHDLIDIVGRLIDFAAWLQSYQQHDCMDHEKMKIMLAKDSKHTYKT